MRQRHIIIIPALILTGLTAVLPHHARAAALDVKTQKAVDGGLEWLSARQSRLGHWSAQDGKYATAITALAGMAFAAEGSTTTQGKYAANIRRAVDYLLERSRAGGLIGDPARDDRYTYGHGFSMLFLSQVLGEEEDVDRRERLVDVLTRAVIFTGRAQTTAGGWGYLSAKDGHDFDEGSTTITQVQGLRGCRNAGIPVPSEIIEKAVAYIRNCTGEDGGVVYSSKSRGSGRPAITAAAVACLFNAGEYDSKYVPKLLAFCRKHLSDIRGQSFGHWHYTHYYYSQVLYREGGETWRRYREKLYAKILSEAGPGGGWTDGAIGPEYVTAINLTMLQLENGTLPIYQR